MPQLKLTSVSGTGLPRVGPRPQSIQSWPNSARENSSPARKMHTLSLIVGGSFEQRKGGIDLQMRLSPLCSSIRRDVGGCCSRGSVAVLVGYSLPAAVVADILVIIAGIRLRTGHSYGGITIKHIPHNSPPSQQLIGKGRRRRNVGDAIHAHAAAIVNGRCEAAALGKHGGPSFSATHACRRRRMARRYVVLIEGRSPCNPCHALHGVLEPGPPSSHTWW